MISLLERFLRSGTRLCERFGADRSGNFAMITALSAMALIGGSGFALDYANMSRVRASLQNSLDSAALAVAQKGKTITDTEARGIAESYLAGNLPVVFKNLDVDRVGESVTVTADVDVKLFFGGILGKESMPVSALSKADVALISYEIALVLDTTGSMSGRKLRDMKTAVEGLVDNISAQVKDPERLRFSLVPFSTFVNVGPQFAPDFDKNGKIVKDTGAPWLDLEGVSEIPQLELEAGVSRFEAYHNMGLEWKGCVETRMPDGDKRHDVADTEAVQTHQASLFVPTFAIDEPEDYRNDYIESEVDPRGNDREKKLKKYGYNGYKQIFKRVALEDLEDNRGPNYMCVSEPLTPLTNDYADLKTKVKKLKASGNTNIMEGVAWGTRVLSPHEPFAGGDPNDGIIKVMVVLTDGKNIFGVRDDRLRSRYSSFGYMVDGRLDGEVNASSSKSTKLMNSKTLEACTYAKADGIDIYTIRLEEDDSDTGTLMSACASRPDQYYDTPSSSQLKKVFEKIGEKIVRLRLST